MTSNSENSKRVAKNTLYMFLRMLLVTIVGFYTSRIILDVLGVSDFGVYNVVGGIVVLFSFLQQALTNATYRFLTYALGENDAENQNRTFSMSMNVHVILSLIVVVLAETLGLWILNNYLVIPQDRIFAANAVYQFSLICFCINIIKTPYNSSIIAHERMNFYAYTSIVEVFFKLLVVFLLYISPFDKLCAYAFLTMCLDAFFYGLYYVYCKKHFTECNYKRCWDKNSIEEMLKYSGWSLVVNATDICVTQSAVFFFNIFFGVVANAALGVANQVTSKVLMFIGSFTQAFNPQIIKSYASNNIGYFFNLIYSTSKISYFLLFLISVPLLLNIDFILDIWLVEVPDNTSIFIFYTILYLLIDSYSAPLWIAVHATGNLKMHQILMSSIKILNIPIAYLMLVWGGEAWTILALRAALNFICSIVRPLYMKRLIQLPLKIYFANVFAPIILTTLLSVPLPLYLANSITDGWARLFITSIISLLIIAVVVGAFGLNTRERELVLQILHLRKNK